MVDVSVADASSPIRYIQAIPFSEPMIKCATGRLGHRPRWSVAGVERCWRRLAMTAGTMVGERCTDTLIMYLRIIVRQPIPQSRYSYGKMAHGIQAKEPDATATGSLHVRAYVDFREYRRAA